MAGATEYLRSDSGAAICRIGAQNPLLRPASAGAGNLRSPRRTALVVSSVA